MNISSNKRDLGIAGLLSLVVVALLIRSQQPSVPDFQDHHHHDHDHHVHPNHRQRLNQNEIADVLQNIDRELAEKPNDPELLSAKVHFAIEYAPDIALQECRRILGDDPTNQFALNHGSLAAMQSGKMQLALTLATECLRVSDTAETRTNVGHVYQRMGKPEQARTFFLKALELDPDYRNALIGLGRE